MTINADFEAVVGLKLARFTAGFDGDDGHPLTTNPLGNGIPYTGREFAAWFADAVDEINPIRETEAANPLTNSSFELFWFLDPDSFKALYGASFSSVGWTYNASLQDGITMFRWDAGSSDAPTADIGDRGVQVTQATSGATGDLLWADTVRRIVWIRNTNGTQFDQTNNVTGTGIDMNPQAGNGNLLSGEDDYLNLFTSGVIQSLTEIRVGQYNDRMGGDGLLTRLTPWYTARTSFPFVAENPSGVKNVGQIDLLVNTQEGGRIVDNRDVYGYAKKWGDTSAFGVGRGLIGRDQLTLETQNDPAFDNGYRNAIWDNGSGGSVEVGDIVRELSIDVDRAIVTATSETGGDAAGNFDYYLIGPGVDFVDPTLLEFFDSTLALQKTADINGAPTGINATTYTDVVYTFGYVEIDIDNGNGLFPYGVEIDPNARIFSQMHERDQFVTRDLEAADMDAGSQVVEGQWYRGVGEELQLFDSQVGSFTEGERVFFDEIEPAGTVTTPDTNGETLDDSTATFQANNVQPGDFVINDTDNSWAIVLSITSETVLETTTLIEGADNQYDASDAFRVLRGTGIVTAFDDTGDRLVIRDRRGPNAPANNDVIIGLVSGATADVLNSPTGIAELRAAPLGSLAGALFLGAQGVGITPANVNSADIQNFSLLPLVGSRQTPPISVSVAANGVVAGDRPFISEVVAAGLSPLVKNHYLVNGTLSQYGLDLDTTVAVTNIRAAAGDVVVVDVSAGPLDNNKEIRYRYELRDSGGFTLIDAAQGTATTISADGTALIDSAADFGGVDDVEIGDVVNNETDGSLGFVAEIVSTTELRLESIGNLAAGLTDGSGNDWGSGDVYSINSLARAYSNAGADTVFVPFVNHIADATSETVTVVYPGSDVDLIFRNRFASGSDPALKLNDDVQFGTLTNTGAAFTARREPNPQAA